MNPGVEALIRELECQRDDLAATLSTIEAYKRVATRAAQSAYENDVLKREKADIESRLAAAVAGSPDNVEQYDDHAPQDDE